MLERFEDHPELETEQRTSDHPTDDMDIPQFFDVER